MINQLLQYMENQGKSVTCNVIIEKDDTTFIFIQNKLHHKFSILKLMENSPFHTFYVSHTHIIDDQPTFTAMENQQKSMISNVIMRKHDHTLFSSKTYYTNKLSIPN